MARRAALIGRGRLICAVVGLAALTGCSSGYGDENRALAATVLELDAVTTTGEPVDKSYCSQDSCWLGDDAHLLFDENGSGELVVDARTTAVQTYN